MNRSLHLTALLLAVVIVLSLAACGSRETDSSHPRPEFHGTVQKPVERPVPTNCIPPENTESTTPTAPATPVVTPLATPAEPDRDSLEQIAELVTGEDYSDLTDEELTDLIEDQLRQEESAGSPADPDQVPVPSEPAVETDPEGYDEQGAMTVPFDQLYPELVETAQVAFDSRTLLLKLPGSMDCTVTEAMAEAGVAKLELLFELENAAWYEASLVLGTDITAAVEQLRALDGILMVDYNYQVRTADLGDYAEIPADLLGNPRVTDQWYLKTCGIFEGMNTVSNPGGSSSVIVAVIDTGVDYDHQDLAGNIWVNEAETPDNGIDDDNNGYIDDYYGVNIVSGTGNGDDDNGHGTHVAGIIAARNNNLGTVGIAYNVQIMPVKAAMASGYLNQSDIARAILYAHQRGAQVINMSFGGTASSIAVQDALAMAYADCVLVASAGNDGAPNEGIGAIPNYPAALSYVLGVMSVDSTGRESGFSNYDTYQFNGVEYELYAPGEYILSTIPGDGYASWSGTSMAAPVVAAMAALLRSEYPDAEMYPTKFIYGQLSATSGRNADCLDVQLHGLHNLPKIMDLYAALTALPEPQVGVSDHYAFNTAGTGGNNGDGVIDAGETIALGLTLHNRWGRGDDLTVTLDTLSMAGIPDPYITLHNPTVDYDSIGTYSTQDAGRIYTGDLFTGWEKPFYITVAPDCPNDYIFTLNVTMSCTNGMDPDDTAEYVTQGTVTLKVRSGKVLPSVISEDMVLTPDNLYIIPSGTVITQGTTVNVEPGTHIQFWTADPEEPYADTYMASLCVNGTLNLGGTKENPVYIYPSDLMSEYAVQMYARNGGELNMTWADVTNLIMYYNEGGSYSVGDGYITTADHCTFRMNYGDGHIRYRNLRDGTVHDQLSNSGMMTHFRTATNCVFYKMALTYGLDVRGTLEGCIFADSALNFYQYGYTVRDCVFLGNCVGIETWDRTAIATTLQIPAAYALLNYKPFLTDAPENTFPFVTDVTIFNKEGEEVTTVSNEEITVRITFNRDMDTSIPLSVQYGSATPFRDYTIEGEFVDARTWEGKKLLTTVIENGTQYFNISNGFSAEDDLMLLPDTARFCFELDTTAAQALIMQGEATAEGISLTWMQDDFDTLMGYNVYRSDSEDGYYQRINDIVIPAETKEFFDDTVELGVVYYYNFTVVKTDLTESTPSGKITIQALDTMAPNIYHTPVYTAKTGSNLVITATVTQVQDTSALGDVDGDGQISALDALLLLQHINDLVNLNAEQFERADLNGDGRLTASEALRILQYVSGAIGSLNG